MAKMLVLFYKLSDTSWIHVNDVVKKTGCAEYKSGDWAKLKHWGLIEEKAKEPDEKNAGFWRITPLGCQFVEKQVYIKSHVLLYNGQFCGFTGDYIDIEHCLGKKISYTKLLKER
jgi:hypothetical protein